MRDFREHRRSAWFRRGMFAAERRVIGASLVSERYAEGCEAPRAGRRLAPLRNHRAYASPERRRDQSKVLSWSRRKNAPTIPAGRGVKAPNFMCLAERCEQMFV